MKATTKQFAATLRLLADTIEQHAITGGDLVSAYIDSQSAPCIHLDPLAFDRVVCDHEWREDADDPEHVRASIGGILFVTVLDSGERFRRESVKRKPVTVDGRVVGTCRGVNSLGIVGFAPASKEPEPALASESGP